MRNCAHCERVVKGYSPRGLCWICYRTPETKALYPPLKRGPQPPGAPRVSQPKRARPMKPVPTRPFVTLGEPTPEEVEAFADWWEHEQTRLERTGESIPKVFTVGRA